MFSIGEFARLGTVSVRALRHYDEIGLLRPAKVDPDTGYRGYSAEQLGQLNRIVALKELGLSLAQVRQLLGGITLDELRGMLMFPFVYHDLARWADERGYQAAGPGREVWVHMADDAAEVSQQVFEIQLPFSRPGTSPS
jgi:DNA-binding transcriptional MerR regulator